jgi:phosphate transport system permease protein
LTDAEQEITDARVPAGDAGARARVYTGRTRRRDTRRRVRLAEGVSRTLITLGGLGTIAAIVVMFTFLALVVLPLGRKARAEPLPASPLGEASAPLLHVAVDESARIAAMVLADGTLLVRALHDGGLVATSRPFGDPPPSAFGFAPVGDTLAVGYRDGTVRVGRLRLEERMLAPADVPPALASLAPGKRCVHGDALAERDAERTVRLYRAEVVLEEPISLGAEILLVDQTATAVGAALATLTADGALRVAFVERKRNLLTRKETLSLAEARLPYAPPPGSGPPSALRLSESGDNLFVAWPDGRVARYDVRDLQAPVEAEVVDLVPGPGERLTRLHALIGRETLVAGDSGGAVSGWFRVRSSDAARAGTIDGTYLARARHFPAAGGAVTAIASSARSRMFAAGYSDGSVRVFQMTTGEVLATLPGDGRPVDAIALAPKEDHIVAIAGGALRAWRFDPLHPEVTFRTLFLPVWYEGYEGPAHVWQSSSGSDAFEPKFGLWSLVFGTLKATLYSMLFGVPLALLAALFTSEFMHRRARATVKSTIEAMASLPSVVLGFLAGIVIAPVVQAKLPAVVIAFYALPIAFLGGAHLWQLLPQRAAVRLSGWPRLTFIALAIPVAIGAGAVLGPPMERLLFAEPGSIEQWLNAHHGPPERRGSAFGGWFLILLPFAGLLVSVAVAKGLKPALRTVSASWSRRRSALVDLAKFGAALGLTLGLGAFLAWFLATIGLDPRGSVVDTYQQRNALVVGFVMGFAIIPIIYTLAEDALASVPGHLRLGSLAAGATPWQTAWRIVVPTAMSGLFSAVMVGLGRAVGETMIVLMATGNTPVLDWNIFSGFRTLAANLAVEMPEAPKGSTHYRVLFLAALTLFGMTFLVNTVAEVVRLRVRRRSFEL